MVGSKKSGAALGDGPASKEEAQHHPEQVFTSHQSFQWENLPFQVTASECE